MDKKQCLINSINRTIRNKGITRRKLAEMMFVTPPVITYWLNGKSNMTLGTIERLEEVLETQFISILNKNHEG